MNLRIKEGSLERSLPACLRLLGFSELQSVGQKGEVRVHFGPACPQWEQLHKASCRGGTHIRVPPPTTLVLSCCAAHERAVHDA